MTLFCGSRTTTNHPAYTDIDIDEQRLSLLPDHGLILEASHSGDLSEDEEQVREDVDQACRDTLQLAGDQGPAPAQGADQELEEDVVTYHGEVLGPGDDARDGADLETLVALQSVAGDVVDEPAALARAQAIIGRVAVAAAACAAAAAEGDQSRSSTPLGNSREKPVRLPAGRAVSEFTPGLFSGAHPELFPFGIGDITLEWAEEEFRTCAFDLKGTETADLKHWMQRLFCAPDGRYAKHPRFLLHLSNIIQRRTAAGEFAMYQRRTSTTPISPRKRC